MGIKSAFSNLHKLYTPKDAKLVDLNGETILIDLQGLLHRMLRENIDSPEDYILQLINFIEKFENYNSKPIFVFDGRPNDSKKIKTVKTRQNAERKLKSISTDAVTDTSLTIDKSMKISLLKKSIKIDKKIADNCKKLFNNLDCMYIHNTNNEADQTIAFISTQYNIKYVYSEDFDMILYDIPYILKSLDYITDTFKLYKKIDILNTLDINTSQLVDIAFLTGTDENCGLYKSSFMTNLNYIKTYGNVTTFIANLSEVNKDIKGHKIILPTYNFNYKLVQQIFTLDTITEMDKINISKQLDYYFKKECENKNTLTNLFKIRTVLEEIRDYCSYVDKYINKILSYSKKHFGFNINIDYCYDNEY